MTFRSALSAILGTLCVLHLYWAFGGRWALDKVNPVVNGRPLLKLDSVSCFSAAFLFFLAAAVPVVSMKHGLRTWLLIGMAVVFAERAVGDFKYVGFFKSVKGTVFAYWDTRVYSPLNVVLAVLAGLCARTG